MKTLEQIKAYKAAAIDGRDVSRLACFLKVEELAELGLELNEGQDPATWAPVPFTKENVRKHLADDLEFGFEKALNKRGISASLMYQVVKMWLWVLDDPLADFDDSHYPQYGLPLLKAVAVKYGLPNPIGDDEGDEHKYSTYG